MHYSILLYETPTDFAARKDPARAPAYWAPWRPYSTSLKDAGVFVGGAGLQPPETATTLRFEDDLHIQDGPHAETAEQLGGFFIIDVPDLDAALEWAARAPRIPGRIVEVRPNLHPLT
jgi:hypothetical protein